MTRQDRLTTVINADGTTEEFAYNSQGNRIKVTDERNNSTTYSFDALNRQTGSTDALGDKVTLTYDADGNLTKDQEPTPAGQTARTTNYTYNSMNELTVVTDPLGIGNHLRVRRRRQSGHGEGPDGADHDHDLRRPQPPDRRHRPHDGSHDHDLRRRQRGDPGGRPDGPDHDHDLRQPGLGGDGDRPAGQRRDLLLYGDRQDWPPRSTTATRWQEEYQYSYNADDELITVEDPTSNDHIIHI